MSKRLSSTIFYEGDLNITNDFKKNNEGRGSLYSSSLGLMMLQKLKKLKEPF